MKLSLGKKYWTTLATCERWDLTQNSASPWSSISHFLGKKRNEKWTRACGACMGMQLQHENNLVEMMEQYARLVENIFAALVQTKQRSESESEKGTWVVMVPIMWKKVNGSCGHLSRTETMLSSAASAWTRVWALWIPMKRRSCMEWPGGQKQTSYGIALLLTDHASLVTCLFWGAWQQLQNMGQWVGGWHKNNWPLLFLIRVRK